MIWYELSSYGFSSNWVLWMLYSCASTFFSFSNKTLYLHYTLCSTLHPKLWHQWFHSMFPYLWFVFRTMIFSVWFLSICLDPIEGSIHLPGLWHGAILTSSCRPNPTKASFQFACLDYDIEPSLPLLVTQSNKSLLSLARTMTWNHTYLFLLSQSNKSFHSLAPVVIWSLTSPNSTRSSIHWSKVWHDSIPTSSRLMKNTKS